MIPKNRFKHFQTKPPLQFLFFYWFTFSFSIPILCKFSSFLFMNTDRPMTALYNVHSIIKNAGMTYTTLYIIRGMAKQFGANYAMLFQPILISVTVKSVPKSANNLFQLLRSAEVSARVQKRSCIVALSSSNNCITLICALHNISPTMKSVW